MIASTTQHQLNPQVITLSLSSIIDAQSLETIIKKNSIHYSHCYWLCYLYCFLKLSFILSSVLLLSSCFNGKHFLTAKG